MHDDSIDSPAALLFKLQGKKAIYHERVTLLIEIVTVSETNGFFKFEARVLKPLNKRLAEKSGLYKKLLQKESFEFGAKYPQAGEIGLAHFEKFKIWGPYCPFTLWFDPDLVKLVENSEDEETKRIAEGVWRG